jgi:Na+-translocating ferredoxin:NAD+ oxidoreductase RnfC subunit
MSNISITELKWQRIFIKLCNFGLPERNGKLFPKKVDKLCCRTDKVIVNSAFCSPYLSLLACRFSYSPAENK